MTMVFGIKCDGGCGRQLLWDGRTNGRRATRAQMEQAARNKGWEAPDKQGHHHCWFCRSEAGRDLWRKRANYAAGLPADYGRGVCPGHPDPADLGDGCSSAGHPGVIPLHPGHPRLRGTDYA